MKATNDREADLLHVLEASAWSKERAQRLNAMAQQHGVTVGTVRYWIKRYKREGAACWTRKKNERCTRLPVETPRIVRGMLEKEPDISAKVIRERLLAEHGMSISRETAYRLKSNQSVLLRSLKHS